MKKRIMSLLLICSVLIGTVSLAYDSGTKNWLGGKWRHGVNSSHVWSNFYHGSKTHETHVQGAGGKKGYSGWVGKGTTAKASWEKAWSGNRAWQILNN